MRRLRVRCVLAVAVVFGILVLTPSPSWACSCAQVTPDQQANAAVTVASGKVDWTATDGQTRTFKVDFDAVYKGAAARSEKLVTAADAAACGVGDLATGRRYLFFIDGRHPGTMRIGLCGGTTPYDEAAVRKVEALTGPPGRPLATSTVEPSTGDDHGRTWAVAGGAAALLAIATAVALVVRRRA
ncbi:LPXTG-motif cell wall-anchored protein [Marmoricola sp. URHA0025 HA25]